MKTLCAVGEVTFPSPSEISVNMMPFVMGDSDSLPVELRQYLPLISACGLEAEQIGKVGYLSITESAVLAQSSQRRPGIHTDKHPSTGWGGGWGRGGVTERRKDGIYMASTVSDSCRAWDTHIEVPGTMGDCEALREELERFPSVSMQANVLYWMTDSCPHESLPMEFGTYRQWFRLVTHKVGLWYAQHSTPNPLGVLPACEIIERNKFAEAEKAKRAA